jgi:phenylpyruvate tautomerase PptA (4-oxalocrotonate tautomerase family)
MPLVRIETRKVWQSAQKKAIMEAVHAALREALSIPETDRQIRYVCHAPEDFEAPPSRTENFTLVDITMFTGRSLAAKKKLYVAIVRNLGTVGIPPNDVFIVLTETPRENWGIRGGVPASEVDLGFKINK